MGVVDANAITLFSVLNVGGAVYGYHCVRGVWLVFCLAACRY